MVGCKDHEEATLENKHNITVILKTKNVTDFENKDFYKERCFSNVGGLMVHRYD